MNNTIKDITQKWIQLRTNPSSSAVEITAHNDMIKVLQELNKLSLQNVKSLHDILKRIKQAQHVTLKYTNTLLHEQVSCIPVEEIHSKTQDLIQDGQSFEQGLTKVLLKWFKNDFFTWVNAVKCSHCLSEEVDVVGMVQPTQEDLKYGASRVELHKCRKCSTLIKFPRYNDPLKLLETRKGRCGEWANAFTFIANVMGLEARYVLDLTDHVWTEVWIPKEKRWV